MCCESVSVEVESIVVSVHVSVVESVPGSFVVSDPVVLVSIRVDDVRGMKTVDQV